MCGIVGVIGDESLKLTCEKLKILEYRGYDSCGLAYFENGKIKTLKSLNKIEDLTLKSQNISSKNICIGHTRWATHGKISIENAHPHLGNKNSWCVVHNGIVENYSILKKKFFNSTNFYSQTDTEVIPNLLELNGGGIESLIKTCKMLKGSYALCCVNKDNKDTLFLAKNKSPLYVGLGKDNSIVASDIYTFEKDFKYYELKDNEFCVLKKDSVEFYNSKFQKINKKYSIIEHQNNAYDLGDYKHYMEKEIFETECYVEYLIKNYEKKLLNFDFKIENIEKIKIIACGSAYYTGLIGAKYLEKFLKIDTNCYIASEFRYSSPILDDKTLCIFISQSGETADTIACMNLCRKKKTKLLSLTNVENCTLRFGCKNNIFMYAGKEIAVATTKAFTCGVLSLYILARLLKKDKFYNIKSKLMLFKSNIKNILSLDIKSFSKKFTNMEKCFFVGRNLDYYSSLEGALKLKEISYINCCAIQSGELKHGTLALIDKETICFASITEKNIESKTLSNIKEIETRGGKVFLITTKNLPNVAINIPSVDEDLDALSVIIFYQLMSYYITIEKNIFPDKPRNLAKSVTVE